MRRTRQVLTRSFVDGLDMNGWALLVLPGFLVLTVVFFIPLLALASNSFHLNAGLGKVEPGLTLQNYGAFLTDPFYLGILLRSFYVGGLIVAICVILGYPVAYFLARSATRWRAALLFMVIAPLLVSVVIRNLGWLPILGSSGLVNWILLNGGLIDQPLQLVNNVTGVVVGLSHALLPFMIISLMTVIQSIEPDLEEASISLGAGPLETFWRVVLPLSRAGLLAGSLLVFTIAISAYTTPAVMGGKRVLVMATYIEQQIRAMLNYAMGATAAAILMVIVIGLTMLAVRAAAQRGDVR
jgi:putative spermidine/putrescine transport system permease protein